MIGISKIIQEELHRQPDLLYWLQKGLCNISDVARYLRPTVEEIRAERVGLESVSMAIRRFLRESRESSGAALRAPKVRNLQVQLEITLLTFQKRVVINNINATRKLRFFSFAQGHTQSMLAISQEHSKRFTASASRVQRDMAAITVTLEGETSKTVGAYTYVTLALALAGIPIAEVVTLHDDITLIIADDDVDNAFKLLRKTLHS